MRLYRLHPPLIAAAALTALLALASALGLFLDDRVLLGVPIWLKPLKFGISLTIYSITLAWLISQITRGRRLGRWLGGVIAGGSIVEIAVIAGQAARGRQSHFNLATPLDSALFSLMGATIGAVWLATAGIAILLLRQHIPDRANALAIRLSLAIALAGLAIGFVMTSPTADQVAGMAQAPPTLIGAHAVGVADGGPGLPLVNWSTTGGDLRVGHFIGMHALQALPLAALALALAAGRARRLRGERTRARLITVAAAGYAGLTGLVTWQALRGQSLVHPDGLTLGTAAGLLMITVLGTLWALNTPAAPSPAPLHPDPTVADEVTAR